MRRALPRLFCYATLASTIVAGPFVAACGDADDTPPPPPPVRTVRVQVVQAADAARARAFSGLTRAGVESKLSFRVSGTLLSLPVNVGDAVTAETVIAQLDPADLELQVQEARAAVAQAGAAAGAAKRNYRRMQQLYEANSVSRAELDSARSNSASAGAQVSALSKRVELARSQLSYATLTAQQAGFVSGVHAEVNENVKAGQAIVTISSGGKPEVTIGLPEALIAGVKKGSAVEVRIDAVPDTVFAATVSEVGVTPEPGMATFPVVLTLDEEDPAVRPGMAAEVTFSFGDEDDAPRFVVPPIAVAEDRNGRFVFLATPAESGFATIERRTVETGELSTAGLEVTSGVTAGDLLVTAGVSKISDGQRVRLPVGAAKAPAAAPAPAARKATPEAGAQPGDAR